MWQRDNKHCISSGPQRWIAFCNYKNNVHFFPTTSFRISFFFYVFSNLFEYARVVGQSNSKGNSLKEHLFLFITESTVLFGA